MMLVSKRSAAIPLRSGARVSGLSVSVSMMATLSRSISDDSLPRARDPACGRFAITRHVTKTGFAYFPCGNQFTMSESRPQLTGNTLRVLCGGHRGHAGQC